MDKKRQQNEPASIGPAVPEPIRERVRNWAGALGLLEPERGFVYTEENVLSGSGRAETQFIWAKENGDPVFSAGFDEDGRMVGLAIAREHWPIPEPQHLNRSQEEQQKIAEAFARNEYSDFPDGLGGALYPAKNRYCGVLLSADDLRSAAAGFRLFDRSRPGRLRIFPLLFRPLPGTFSACPAAYA